MIFDLLEVTGHALYHWVLYKKNCLAVILDLCH
jgi:hypothetical protein